MSLSIADMTKLANRSGVNSNAVLNFLMTIESNDSASIAGMNLEMDAKLYRWNAATKAAIRAGIQKHFYK